MLQQTPSERWIARALRAELKLFRAGLSTYDPSSAYNDDEWLARTFEHKDERPATIDDLLRARARLAGL